MHRPHSSIKSDFKADISNTPSFFLIRNIRASNAKIHVSDLLEKYWSSHYSLLYLYLI